MLINAVIYTSSVLLQKAQSVKLKPHSQTLNLVRTGRVTRTHYKTESGQSARRVWCIHGFCSTVVNNAYC